MAFLGKGFFLLSGHFYVWTALLYLLQSRLQFRSSLVCIQTGSSSTMTVAFFGETFSVESHKQSDNPTIRSSPSPRNAGDSSQ